MCLCIVKPGSLNRAAVGWAVFCPAFGFFFLVLSVKNPKPPGMLSSSANYRPFFSSFRHTSPQESFVQLVKSTTVNVFMVTIYIYRIVDHFGFIYH